jgi:hypothetical protein
MSEFVLEEDGRYKQGQVFLDERKYEEAINLFSSLLQTW